MSSKHGLQKAVNWGNPLLQNKHQHCWKPSEITFTSSWIELFIKQRLWEISFLVKIMRDIFFSKDYETSYLAKINGDVTKLVRKGIQTPSRTAP